MSFGSFEEIAEHVRNSATEESKSRIEDELELFSRRGWKSYVLFLINLLLKLDFQERYYLFWSMSAKDSYVICKTIGQDYLCQKLLRSNRSQDVLFNDALRLDLDVVGLKGGFLEERTFLVGNVIEEELKKSKLNYVERIIPQERNDDGCQYIILSKEQITDEEVNAVVNESSLGNEVDDILRKLLIIRFGYRNRL